MPAEGRADGVPEASVPSGLRRDLGLLDATGIGLGAVVGAGLFVVTGVAAGVAGPAFVVGLALAALAAACNALSSAQLAAAYPVSGGTYAYGRALLGPWPGFAAGWVFTASKLAAGGTVALGFGAYLAALVPGVPPRAAAVAAALALGAANLAGVRRAGRLNTALVAVTLGTLGYFVVAGVPAFDAGRLAPFAPEGAGGVLRAAALLFFAYTGYARIATLGGEVRDPARTIPRAIGLTVLASSVLYAAVALVAVGAVGAPALAATAAPLAVAAERMALPGVGLAVGLGAATAMLGVLLSQVLGVSRMLFALAEGGDLPGALARVDARGVPRLAVALTVGAVVLVALVGTLEAVVAAAAFTILVYYGITNAAALRLPPAQRRYPRGVAALGLAACAVLALALPPATVGAGLGLLALGGAWRLGWTRVAPGRTP